MNAVMTNGLSGVCIFGCKRKREDKRVAGQLQKDDESAAALKAQQEAAAKALQVSQQKIQQAEMDQAEKRKKYLLYGGIGVAVIVVGVLVMKGNKKKSLGFPTVKKPKRLKARKRTR